MEGGQHQRVQCEVVWISASTTIRRFRNNICCPRYGTGSKLCDTRSQSKYNEYKCTGMDPTHASLLEKFGLDFSKTAAPAVPATHKMPNVSRRLIT